MFYIVCTILLRLHRICRLIYFLYFLIDYSFYFHYAAERFKQRYPRLNEDNKSDVERKRQHEQTRNILAHQTGR
jgi:hypothetical protein